MADPTLAIWMFPALFGLVLLGIPVGFALIVTAAAFGWPFFEDLLPRQIYGRLTELAGGFAFAAVPAFIFMGAILERAGIAERLFDAMRIWLGRLPGGLAVAAGLLDDGAQFLPFLLEDGGEFGLLFIRQLERLRELLDAFLWRRAATPFAFLLLRLHGGAERDQRDQRDGKHG